MVHSFNVAFKLYVSECNTTHTQVVVKLLLYRKSLSRLVRSYFVTKDGSFRAAGAERSMFLTLAVQGIVRSKGMSPAVVHIALGREDPVRKPGKRFGARIVQRKSAYAPVAPETRLKGPRCDLGLEFSITEWTKIFGSSITQGSLTLCSAGHTS